MTPQPVAPATGPTAVVPRTLMLGYVAGAATPTRIRKVAFWSAAALAALLMLLGLASALPGAWVARSEYRKCSVYPPGVLGASSRGLLWMAVRDAWRASWAFVAFLGAPLLACGISLALNMAGVRAGRRGACAVARWTLPPVMLLAALLAAGLCAALCLETERPEAAWWADALRAGLVALLILAMLPMLDLMSFRAWIPGHPFEEKPPQPFLPERRAGVAAPREEQSHG